MSNKNDEEEACPHEQYETTKPKLLTMFSDFVLQTEQQTNINEAIIEQQAENDNELLPSITRKVPLFRRIAARFPRSYYCFTQILVPLLILLVLTVVFGWFLALFEAPREIQDNDAALGASYSDYLVRLFNSSDTRAAIQDASVSCLSESFNNETVTALISTADRQNLLQNVEVCAKNYSLNLFPYLLLDEIFTLNPKVPLTFNWITCDRSNQTNIRDDTVFQHQQYSKNFNIDFLKIFNHEQDYVLNKDDEEVVAAIHRATGSHGCRPHVGGGALFWFTVMTTIGYGNATPNTIGGRVLIYTLGFITIVGFIALNANASFILDTIVDDLLLRLGLRRLTKGIGAVLLWLFLLIFWMLVVALAFRAFWLKRIGEPLPLSDAYWFSYITATTVGLGDIYVEHSEFRVLDMFYVPLLMLTSFVFLGNFASKLAACMVIWFPADLTLDSILASSRKLNEEPEA